MVVIGVNRSVGLLINVLHFTRKFLRTHFPDELFIIKMNNEDKPNKNVIKY